VDNSILAALDGSALLIQLKLAIASSCIYADLQVGTSCIYYIWRSSQLADKEEVNLIIMAGDRPSDRRSSPRCIKKYMFPRITEATFTVHAHALCEKSRAALTVVLGVT
jgi:hypothetical protein